MKNLKLVLALSLLVISQLLVSQRTTQCKDHPLFPVRMPHYFISKCKVNFEAVQFNLLAGGVDMISKEGLKTFIRYEHNLNSRRPKPSVLDILKHYENAAMRYGGTTVFLNVSEAIAVFKILKNGHEYVWIKIQSEGSSNNDFYDLTILELEEMKHDISATDMFTSINLIGHIPLHIHFETGEFSIKSVSQPIIDQLATMLKENPTLKIRIDGHTDNVGTPAINKTLSKNRANAIRKALIAKGIKKSRLSIKGWGQENPISENDTEDGKAKNRRIDIVKR